MKLKTLQCSFQILRMARMIFIFLLVVLYTCDLSAQNIGINQPNPLWPLDIAAPQSVIRLVTTTSNFGSTLELKNDNSSAEYLGVINFNNSFNSYPGQIAYKTDNFIFKTSNQEQMRIDNSGRMGIGRIPTDNRLEVEGNVFIQNKLGIGTTVPQYPIDLTAAQGVVRLISTNAAYGSVLEFRNESPGGGEIVGSINFNNGAQAAGQIAYTTAGDLIYSFYGSEKMRINAFGWLGIGRIPVGNKLEVEGAASKWTAGDWFANSDARLKKNIKPLDSQAMLDTLLMLEGVSYEWNDDKTGSSRPEGTQYGFIAQNIQEAFPTLVEEDNLGYLQTAYGTYDPMMVEAIRALNDKIKSLESENEELKSSIEEIKRWIDAKNQYYEKSE